MAMTKENWDAMLDAWAEVAQINHDKAVSEGRLVRYTSPTGQQMWVHNPKKCANDEHCVFHNPSEHSMRGWPMNVRETGLIERICKEHNVGHPDPDSVAFFESQGWSGYDVHGCCGCCHD